MIKVNNDIGLRISQGDIYKNVEYIENFKEEGDEIKFSKIIFPYVVILTQDCDLAQDCIFRNDDSKSDDKIILSVLVAPLYNVDHFFQGAHLSELGKKMMEVKQKKKGKLTTDAKNIFQNNNPRYHYLEFDETVDIVPSIIDFKQYFSLNTDYLYEIRSANFVCNISSLYREDISHRFASFLARIGLP